MFITRQYTIRFQLHISKNYHSAFLMLAALRCYTLLLRNLNTFSKRFFLLSRCTDTIESYYPIESSQMTSHNLSVKDTFTNARVVLDVNHTMNGLFWWRSLEILKGFNIYFHGNESPELYKSTIRHHSSILNAAIRCSPQ